MIKLQHKEDCCGCTACSNICPNNCITMTEDNEGFLYPIVDAEKCINCGLCIRTCPIINNPFRNIITQKVKAYLVRTRDFTLLSECTSGGVFTTIAKEYLKYGGIAYGAVFDSNYDVIHKRIDNISSIHELPGSKYVQSNLIGIFKKVKNDVKGGKKIVFCGTPCQIAGLKNYIGKDYSNLILIDLVCHGVPSPKLWRTYLDTICNQYGILKYVNFRSKRLGYHVSVMEEKFTTGKSRFGSARTNLMLKCFFQNVADRPSCYNCEFKTIDRCSDLTLFDGWHADKYVKGLLDDDKGYTVVLSHSEKGTSILKQMKDNFDIYLINAENAIYTDGKMAVTSVEKPKERDEFYWILDDKGIKGIVDQLFPISKSDYIIEYIKVIMKKIGILSWIKKVKG